MFSLEMCHLLNYSFCFYFAIGLRLFWSFALHIFTVLVFFTPGEPRGPGDEILYPRIPGGESCERGWLPYAAFSILACYTLIKQKSLNGMLLAVRAIHSKSLTL